MVECLAIGLGAKEIAQKMNLVEMKVKFILYKMQY